MSEEIVSLVIDNGSGWIKAGRAGETFPDATFPTVIGRSRYVRSSAFSHGTFSYDKKVYIGNETVAEKGILSLHSPIERGTITNWEEMENIWRHTFYKELTLPPEEHPVLLSDTLQSKWYREKMMVIMFETFNVPAAYVQMQAVLALYGNGRTTGIVCDSGEGVTHFVPVYEGYNLPEGILRLELAGSDIDKYLMDLLLNRQYYPGLDRLRFRGLSFRHGPLQPSMCDAKERLCYVALNYDSEMNTAATSSSIDRTYTMPDGEVVVIRNERFRCTEALFNPSLVGLAESGVHRKIHESIMKCEAEVRKDLYSNVVLSGGSTLFDGFAERVNKELIILAPNTMKIKVIASPERKLLAWTGGSILASLTAFEQMWISKAEYDESGPGIVHRKCF